jgi:hypothetical protein
MGRRRIAPPSPAAAEALRARIWRDFWRLALRLGQVLIITKDEKKALSPTRFVVKFWNGPRSRVSSGLPLLRSCLHHGRRHFIRDVFHD